MNHFFNLKITPVLGGVLLGLLLSLSTPAKVSALTVSGCGDLSQGGTVNCGITTIYMVDPITLDLTTTPFADLTVAITWLADGATLPVVTNVQPGITDTINPAGDFVYQYQIQDVFTSSVTDLNFTFLFGGDVEQSGFVDDAGASPIFTVNASDLIKPGIDTEGNFSASYDPALIPNPTTASPPGPALPADTLFVRSFTTPGLNTLSMTGDFTGSTIGAAFIIGPGQGSISGTSPVPEPSTLLLLGSGLLALAGWRRKI